MTAFDARTEFDRQVGNLVSLGYPRMAQLSDDDFRATLAPLRETATEIEHVTYDPDSGHVPFVLVVTRDLVPTEQTVPRTTLHGKDKPGFIDRSFEPGALQRFVATKEIRLPDQRAYVLLDVDRGEEFCGAIPHEAVATIARRGRSPLTIEEGVALITHYPRILAKNKCFSLGGSRSTDKRVPALWISQQAPKLGWCWQGNPHTWLGMASAGARRTT